MTTSAENLFADVLKAKEAEKANQTQTQTTEPDADETETPSPADELAMLKNRAKLMGITHSPNIGVEALKAKIQAKLDGEADKFEEKEPEVTQTNTTNVASPAPTLTPQQKKMALRKKLEAEKLRLVRLRITNLNPAKKDLPGEIFTVGNRILGTVKKFIPYGEATDNGYHVPYWIYEQLRDREFQHIKVSKDSRGRETVTTRMVREFALEVLPQLTAKDLAQLAAQQAAAEGMD